MLELAECRCKLNLDVGILCILGVLGVVIRVGVFVCWVRDFTWILEGFRVADTCTPRAFEIILQSHNKDSRPDSRLHPK